MRSQVDHEPRLGARDQVSEEARFQPRAVDEHDGRIRCLAGVTSGRPKRVRVGSGRQHHVQRQAVTADPGDDVADDVGGRHDRQEIRRRPLPLILGKGQGAGQRHDGNDERPYLLMSHGKHVNDNAISLQASLFNAIWGSDVVDAAQQAWPTPSSAGWNREARATRVAWRPAGFWFSGITDTAQDQVPETGDSSRNDVVIRPAHPPRMASPSWHVSRLTTTEACSVGRLWTWHGVGGSAASLPDGIVGRPRCAH